MTTDDQHLPFFPSENQHKIDDEKRRLWLGAASIGDLKSLQTLATPELLDAVDQDENTAAILCARIGHAACLFFLIPAGCDLAKSNVFDRTAAMEAAYGGNTDCLDALLHATYDRKGTLEERRLLKLAVSSGNPSCVSSIIDAGWNIDGQDVFGATAAMEAALDNDIDCLRVLSQAGCNLNLQDDLGNTAFMHAYIFNDLDALRLMLNEGCNPNIADNDGFTLAHHAVKYGRVDILSLLIEFGIDLHLKNYEGETLMDLAAKNAPRLVAHIQSAIDAEALKDTHLPIPPHLSRRKNAL